ncbi:ankyrin repeat domain-containing protein 50-like [Saccostrea echinata]|uniref:ankyrin repeat domain-containing protein 50-like n=1 Tax=Saccostrea echinata TaxID=191078 RepID=UPI002A8049AF|nr:ankyrin repeat domain-containing protein 50-like [Saccostrea echinata]
MYRESSNLTPFPKLVVKKSKAVDLQKVKLLAENFIGKTDVIVDELPGFSKVDSAKIEELGTLLDLFSFLLSKNYFSSTDVVFMQILLRRIKREDLEKMCIKYATEDSKALCYYAESEKPVNGYTHVHFHISENIINYPREYAEKIRETVAILVGCPMDCQDCLQLDGIRHTSSFNIVFQMKNEYVKKLLNLQPQNFAVLGRYSVDKIIVGGQTIHIDCSEMYHQQKMLQKLIVDDSTYYETSAYKVVFEKMMKTNVVVLVGEPGCGKTSLAHHLALQLNENYNFCPISNITDINHLFHPNQSQFFLLNLCTENIPHPFLLSHKELHLIAGCLFRSQYISLPEESANVKCSFEPEDEFQANTTESGQMTFVEKWIDHGADINHCRIFEGLSLFAASESEYLTVVEILIQLGADINQCDEYGESPLIAASRSGHLNVVEKLIDYGADINQCDEFGRCPLFAASRSGHLNVVEKLIDCGADIYRCDGFGRQPLFAASQFGHLSVVEKLIECGADVNKCDKNGNSPLVAASRSGYLTVVEKLIDHGADINQCDEFGRCPLFAALQLGHLNVVEKLIDCGADICRSDGFGRQPLFAASQYGHMSVVEKLIECGADINKCDRNSESPLIAASRSGHLNVVEKLIDYGADINQCDEFGRCPLFAASRSGHLNVVEKLIDCGADIYRCDGFGRQPLFAASQYGHMSVVEKLIECGADVNKCDKYGESPLVAASRSGHSYKNVESQLIAASKSENLSVEERMIDHVADINQSDSHGKYSFFAAFESGHKTALEKQTEHDGTWNDESVVHHYSRKKKSKTNVVNKRKSVFLQI